MPVQNTPDIRRSGELPQRRHRRRDGSATIGRHSRPVCEATGKSRYRDHHQATDALTGARRQRSFDLTHRGSSARAETRAYKCDSCRGWHLTSRTAFIDARFVPADGAQSSVLVVEAVAA